MRRISAVVAGLLLAGAAGAETVINDYRTNTVITPSATYVVTTTPSTTYVVGPNTGATPIAITPSAGRHTYITPTGTYMSIPMGKTTTVIQVSGARK